MNKRKNECRSPVKRKSSFIPVIYNDKFKEYEIISNLLKLISYEVYTTLVSDCFKVPILKNNIESIKKEFLDEELCKKLSISKSYKTKLELLNDFEKINHEKPEITIWIAENIIAEKLQIYANNNIILDELKKSENILNLFCCHLSTIFSKLRLINFYNKIKKIKKRKCKQDIKSLYNFIKDNNYIDEYIYNICIENSAIKFEKKIKNIFLKYWFREYKINVGMIELKTHTIFDIKLNNMLDQLSYIKIID